MYMPLFEAISRTPDTFVRKRVFGFILELSYMSFFCVCLPPPDRLSACSTKDCA
jgi:hypothetical protein